MIDINSLNSEIEKKYSSEIVEIINTYCELRSLSKTQLHDLSNKYKNQIKDISYKFKFEYLKIHLKNIFTYLETQIILHKEIDVNFSEFNYWNYEDWIFSYEYERSSIFNPKKNLNWSQISQYFDLEMISNKPHTSYPYKSWLVLIEDSEKEVSDDYYKNSHSQMKKPIKSIISFEEYKKLWIESKKSKDIVIYHIQQINFLKKLVFKMKVIDNMETDYKFFIFLFENIEDTSKLLRSINSIVNPK